MLDKQKSIDNPSLKLLERAKDAILGSEPDADIFLFGSRARGDYNDDSDWDLLVLVPGELNYERERRIIHIVNDIEIDTRQIFNLIIHRKDYWRENLLLNSSPFIKNVNKDKIRL